MEVRRLTHRRMVLLAIGCAALQSCGSEGLVFPQNPGAVGETLASGYWIPDGLAVINEEEFLFADRDGAVHYYLDGEVTQLQGVPQSRTSGIYGGLLDVSLHPDFDENRLVYIAYDNPSFRLSVARFELRDGRAEDVAVIYESADFSIGSRIEWESSSHFFLSFGIGGDPYPDPGPQNLGEDVGKIHRLTADGTIPADNPVFPGSTGPSTVWSYGHRNPQGLHYDSVEQRLYATEHGPLGGDELNLVTAGGNYGWPLFSYGLNYDETLVSNMTEEEAAVDLTAPVHFWGPDFRVAPSGLLYLEDGPFASSAGSFLMGALNPQHLLRYDPDTEETRILLEDAGRIRDVARLPSGMLLVAIDEGSPESSDPGRIVLLDPGEER